MKSNLFFYRRISNEVVNTERDQLDLKSLSSYGIHGALGLLMGIGAGYIVFYIIAALTSAISSKLIGVTFAFAFLIIYFLFGLYAGYIFGGQKKSSVFSKTYATAGILGGIVVALLLEREFIKINSLLDPLFISLVFAGPILGFPKIKNMIIMTISCCLGAVLGYGLNTSSQNIVLYINSIWTQGALFAFFIGILFPLLATGLAGALIAIGIYFAEGTSYAAREIPQYLKNTRAAGIFMAFIILFFSGLMFMDAAKYAYTDVSIDISSADGNTIVLVPVILENGTVMEMYGNPSISGNAVSEIIDTDHGKAFKIKGSGPIEIKMKQNGEWIAPDPEANDKFFNGFTLSTSNVTRFGEIHDPIDAWIYSEEDGVMFSISIKRNSGWGREVSINTEGKEKLIRGWQVIRLSMGGYME